MGKLYDSTLTFHNDWKDYTNEEIKEKKISVVIPTYHPRYLKDVLDHLSKLNSVYEVVTVFDGQDDNPDSIIDDYNYHLTILRHDHNRNAPAANNTGAVHASGDIILFMDQDMILSPSFIPNAYKLFSANDYSGLVVGFRDTLPYEQVPKLENWQEADYTRDWRVRTPVNDSYLDLTIANCGSATNNCENNNILEIYKRSNHFRDLGTRKESTLAFWDLPCMVISHTLAVPREDFLSTGGFPEWIIGWGGEDIALGFLSVARHLKIIPNEVGSYHIEHAPHSGSEEKKWAEMRENLKKYKQWTSTVDEFPVINEEACKKRVKTLYKS